MYKKKAQEGFFLFIWRKLLSLLTEAVYSLDISHSSKYLIESCESAVALSHPNSTVFVLGRHKNMSPSHTAAHKQSSLLATQKNTGIPPSVFLRTVVCGHGESDSDLIVGNDTFYH